MRVICPHTRIHPETEAALQRYAPTAERIAVNPNDDTDYARVLCAIWAAAEDTLIVEHDIEIHAKVVNAARRCPEQWCVWPYNGPGWEDPNGDALIYESLGCTRFRASLMRAEPDLMTVAAAMSQGLAAGDWRRMDVSILPTLKARGYRPHRQSPPVLHHHVYNGRCACEQVHEELT